MSRAMVLLAMTPFLTGCSAAAADTEQLALADNCSFTSNIEYTECWQKLAGESRAKVVSTFDRARRAAQKSDELESYGAGKVDATSMGLENSLTNSQEEWIGYSDRQCRFEGWIARGGTGTRSIVAKCKHRLNLQRIGELENAIKFMEESY